jgi:hypothetical protein
VVLLLDCCYAGAFERGMVARAAAGVGVQEHFGGRGRAVITATSAMEYAFEADELAGAREVTPSVFTSALVVGLETGEADRDQDGQVGLDELYDYVFSRVREVTPKQTPGKWTFGVEGELYIARRSRPVTRPAPLPADLQQAIGHSLPSVRVAAVHELEQVLLSGHEGRALAARLALEQLAADDSRSVSAAAASVVSRFGVGKPALSEAAPVRAAATPVSAAAAPRGDARSMPREARWWLGMGALIAFNVAATLLVTWWAITWWNEALYSGYLPGGVSVLLTAGIFAAAWSIAYVAQEAVSGPRGGSPWRQGVLPARLAAGYRDLLGSAGAGRFLRALLATPPVNVLLLMALSLGVAALAFQYLSGSAARDYTFILVCVLANGLALAAVFRPKRP